MKVCQNIVLVLSIVGCNSCSSLLQSEQQQESELKIITLRDHVSSRLLPNSSFDDGTLFVINIDGQHEREALNIAFHNSRPRLICGTNELIYGEHGVPFYRPTGAKAIVFTVRLEGLALPVARVTTRAYSANLGSESFHYTLKLSKGHWKIIQKSQGPSA